MVLVHLERRVANPIIDLEILKGKPFNAANAYNFLFGLAAVGIVTLVPFFTVSVYSKSILMSGIIPMPVPCAFLRWRLSFPFPPPVHLLLFKC